MIEAQWAKLCNLIADSFNIDSPQIESILFLIGLQELQKFDIKLNKDAKLDVIHIAICVLLSNKGYYLFSHLDEDGWPHFKNIKKIPYCNSQEQTVLLKKYILAYFSKIYNFN